jgi:uncharacterized glyoxalase superfamily protein PhnB
MADQHLPSVYPLVRYQDPAKGIRFLTEAFGFTEHMVYEEPGAGIVHAQVAWGTGLVMVGPSHGETDPFDLGRTSIYLAVDDPDAHHDRAVAAGAEIVMPLTDQDYGSRDFAVRDPEGNLWNFGTYDPAAAQADAAAGSASS